MQSIYALSQSKNADITKEEKFLKVSMENMYNLYLVILALLVEIQKKAEEQLTLSQKKYLATSEEKNPNKKFVNNELLQRLVHNQKLADMLKERKISWDLDGKYVDQVFDAIVKSNLYATYMGNPETSFKDDRKFIADIFRSVIAENDKLYEYIEDHNLTWLDDLPLVNTMILKIIEKTKPAAGDEHFLPDLFKDEDDLIFAKELLKKTVLNYEKLQEEMEGKTPNWDAERIAEIDGILLKMAICELLKFPTIPVKVTINEYVEVAKEYSTPKSSVFINGILDKLVKEYQEENKLNKIGRGLM